MVTSIICGLPLVADAPRRALNALRYEILLAGHDDATAGNLGIFKTHEKLRSRYYWRDMFQDVRHWCRSCVHCAMKKGPHGRKLDQLVDRFNCDR